MQRRIFLGEATQLAGIFEIAEASGKKYFFKLTASDGTVVAVSPLFNTIKGAAAGIRAVRESAATGHIVDNSQRRGQSVSPAGAARGGARLAPS
jgi:uncharacterized protein YegP (UPF0339 family)